MTKTVKLYEVATISTGNSAPQDEKLFKNGVHNFVRTSDVGQIRKGVIFEAKDKLNDIGILKLKKFPKGTILFPKSGASIFLNHRVMLGEDAYVSSHLATIKGDNSKILDRYLLHILQTIYAENLVADSGYPSLKTQTISKIELVLPSLPEQQLIVAKLDAVFAEIENLIILTKEKIKNIDLLKNQFLDTILNKINITDTITINDFCYTSDFVANGSFASLADNVKYLDDEDYAILVRLTDYRKNFKSKLKYVSKKSYEFLKHSKLKEGDLILTNVGAYCGTPFLIPKLNKPATLGPNAILVRPDSKIMHNEYLKIFFASSKGQSLLNSISSGTTHKKFNKTSLRKMKIEIPKLNEQIDTINKIREINEEINRLKMNMDISIKNYLSLKKSFFKNILNKNELEHERSRNRSSIN